MMICCGDISLRAVYSRDWEVRNKCYEHYILSKVDTCNLMTKRMLSIKYFKLKHRAKLSCQTGSASNRNANTHLYDSACTKIWGNGSIIKEIVQTCEWSCLLHCCWIECFLCIVDVHVFNAKKRYNRSVTWYSFLLILSIMVGV